MPETLSIKKLERYSEILKRIGGFTNITESELFEILNKNQAYLNDYNRELLMLMKGIYTIEELQKDMEREKIFQDVKDNIIKDLPNRILDRLNYLDGLDYDKEKNHKIYREFILLLDNHEIEITDNEIIYPKKGISILIEKIAFELNPLPKEKVEYNHNPSCSLPEPEIGLRFSDEINKIQNNLSDNYFMITKEHIEELTSDNHLADIQGTDGVLLSIFFLPRSNNNIILSTSTEEKTDHSNRFTTYEYYIDILNNGNLHQNKLDNNRRLEGNILTGRHAKF